MEIKERKYNKLEKQGFCQQIMTKQRQKKKKSDERPLTPKKKDQFAVNKKAKSNLRNSKLTTM